ncbi:hypothetical protein CASFOL_008915 [Castilleja foliolosa]|uniref:Xylanase inhibitor C-terminal domain-containing protein n=1 Tax=Castilleja foliolosa TaxID=1961234 RepID=A0ABD3E2E3_9LAMI
MLAWSDRRDSGCIVDSGYSVTTLPSAIYKKLRETLIKNHFSRYTSKKMFARFKLCYYFSSKNETIDDLPYHFPSTGFGSRVSASTGICRPGRGKWWLVFLFGDDAL